MATFGSTDVMHHCKVVVTELDQVRVQFDDVKDVFACKSVRTQTLLDFGKNFDMRG